ncbi:hypothetical protein ccbrp13_07540 [Ktedonobacteria bacterium brp13]|nr:hypothetical protein ccbrp13_07540 [Ktedonobacteria bacterium brp13]
MDQVSTEAAQLKASRVFLFVIIFFGALWAAVLAISIGGNITTLLLGLVALLTIGFIVAAILFIRAARTIQAAPSPLADRRKRLIYIGSIIFEAAAYIIGYKLFIVQHPEYQFPLLAIVVGLHFIGLAYVFNARRYIVIAVIFCGIALIVLLIPRIIQVGTYHINTWLFLIGLVCASVLWGSAVSVLNKGRSLFRQK